MLLARADATEQRNADYRAELGAWVGRASASSDGVPEQALPVFAGVPGIDSVTSFAVEVPGSCPDSGAAGAALEVVIDGAAVRAELDASARVALDDLRAAC